MPENMRIDAAATMQALAEIAVRHDDCDATISDAIALIERLTPTPMTVERAVEVLNEIELNGMRDWEQKGCDDEIWVVSEYADNGFLAWAAVAIAQAYKEKEAANV